MKAFFGRLTPSRGRRDSVNGVCCGTARGTRGPRVSAKNISAGGVSDSDDVSEGGDGGALVDCAAA